MDLESERVGRLPRNFSSSKRNFLLYGLFLTISVGALLASSFISYEYSLFYGLPLKVPREVTVSLKNALRPSFSDSGSKPRETPIPDAFSFEGEASKALEALRSFKVPSTNYVLAYIGASDMPESLYSSSESLSSLFKGMLNCLESDTMETPSAPPERSENIFLTRYILSSQKETPSSF